MKIAYPALIGRIDAYAVKTLGISEEALIRRAGEAVADCVCERFADKEKTILVLAGGGNNGADGYAAALFLLSRGYKVRAVDLFGKGQRSEGGRAVLASYKEVLGEPLSFSQVADESPDIVIDAIFGTGFSGALPMAAVQAAEWVRSKGASVVSVDVPLGVDATYGGVLPGALCASLTVVLSYMKTGLLSYPALDYLGEVMLRDVGLDIPEIHRAFPELRDATDEMYIKEHLPSRAAASHKGSFGKAVLFVGSEQYPGAAALATEATLRAGVGLVTVASEMGIVKDALARLPEALYRPFIPFSLWTKTQVEEAIALTDKASAVLLGCGCGRSEALCALTYALLDREGAPLVLDADAINSLAKKREESLLRLKNAKREVLLTPHPLELARLLGQTVNEVQANRMRVAWDFAKEYGVSLLLKGARSVIAVKEDVFVNTTGSSALAKGGTGDVLAGLVTALLAQGATPEVSLRIGAYLHGRAAQMLAKEVSEYGVLPSSLPLQIAKEISEALKSK